MAELNPEHRDRIWSALDELARHHRAFEDAPWALKQPDLAQIEELANLFRPADPVVKYRYLFDSDWPDVGHAPVNRVADRAEGIRDERLYAVREIFDAEGLPGVQRLNASVKEAFALGRCLGESGVAVDEDAVMFDIDSEDLQRAGLAGAFTWQRLQAGGRAWLDTALPKLQGRPLAQARLLRGVRDELEEAWNRAATLGSAVEAAYWKEFIPLGLGPEFPLANATARHLVDHGRPGAATDLLSLYADNLEHPLEPELVITCLTALVESAEDEQRAVSPYELQRLLELLRTSDVDPDQVAFLEWRLLPGLGYGVPAPNLEARIARDPTFFVELMSMCFKRADGERDGSVPPDVAQNAYRLLHEWEIVPGSTERKGAVDEEGLRRWVEEARSLLVQGDRLDIGELYVGHVFAHAKEDSDGTWPTRPVRNTIEWLASPMIERGFGTEIHNMRGVTSRRLGDGGKQEYDMAEQYEKWASAIANESHRTAAVLRAVAEDYRTQGRQNDEEAERFKKGLDTF